MIPNTLTFLLSYKCNIRCGHCCFSCGPKYEDVTPFLDGLGLVKNPSTPSIPTLTEDKILAIIDQASSVSGLRTIVFSGGEPTLFPDVLVSGITRAKSYGFTTRIVTNAFWGKTPETASSMLGRLRKAGLDEVCISYGDYHAEFITLSTLRTSAITALDLGMNIAFSLVRGPQSRITKEYIKNEIPLRDEFIGTRVFFFESDVVSTGRGEQQKITSAIDDSILPLGTPQVGCKAAGTAPAITPDGKFMACCGFPHREIQELEVGDTNMMTLSQLCEDMSQDLLLHWIHRKGPREILKTIRPDSAFIRGNICQACKELFTDTTNRKLLASYLERHSTEELFGDLSQEGTAVEKARLLFVDVLKHSALTPP